MSKTPRANGGHVRTAKRVVAVGAAVTALAALGAAPAERTLATAPSLPHTCVEGLAADAGRQRPHVVDPAGDGAVHAVVTGMDVTAVWVSEEDKPPWIESEDDVVLPLAKTGRWSFAAVARSFAANIVVEDLGEMPAATQVVVAVGHSDGTRHFAAERLPQGDWKFTYGEMDEAPTGSYYVERGPTTGTVDLDAGTVMIDFVGKFQLPPDSGGDYSITVDYVGTFVPLGSHSGFKLTPRDMAPRGGWAAVETDGGANSTSCAVWLSALGSE